MQRSKAWNKWRSPLDYSFEASKEQDPMQHLKHLVSDPEDQKAHIKGLSKGNQTHHLHQKELEDQLVKEMEEKEIIKQHQEEVF